MKKMISAKEIAFFMVLLGAMLAPGCAAQRTFATPDQAVSALVTSLRDGDRKQTREILGPSESDELNSGDKVADQNNIQHFVALYDEKHTLVPNPDGDITLIVGTNEWPLPFPLVKEPGKDGKDVWRFDTAAGVDEIVNRRVGRNELDTIQTCLAICDAQREYAMADPDHDGVPAYAQKFRSDPDKKNGLYWESKDGQPESPLGPMMADAQEQGYFLIPLNKPQPYHGYYYHILKAQGAHAAGGARDYMVGKQMLGGFAIVAFPVEYGSSGIKTFIVNQEGIVYERDLGLATPIIAGDMKEFDPGPEWKQLSSAETTPPGDH